MFFSKKLEKFKNLKHCFFSRKNGVSKGYYESLNCGLGSNDKKENVFKNLEWVAKKITCRKEYLMAIKTDGKTEYKPILGLSTDRYAK